MATTSAALATAIQHHQAGRLQAAEQIYRQILEAEPNHADAIHLLGVIAHQAGKHELAVEYIRRAIALKGNAAAFHNNLGGAYCALHKIPEAVACYRRALELKPDYAEVHSNLGVAFKEQGKLDEAVACYRRALELNPHDAKAHNNLGNAFQDQGKPDEAVACYRQALELWPDYAEAHSNLGNALKEQGKPDDAVACYRRALELNPDFAGAQSNLGNVLKDQGKLDEAVACCRRALELEPDFAEAHYHLGSALKDQGKLDEAADCCRRALELKPDYAEAHVGLGNALMAQGKLDEAVARYRRALELKPGFAETYNNLGNALKDQGMLDEAVACYRRALELQPDRAEVHSNLLLTLQYCAAATPQSLAEAHAEYDRTHAAHLRARAGHENVRERYGRPRLGFVSRDLGRHPVGYFLVRVLENLGQGQYETICYSDQVVTDDVTRRLQAAATQWRDVTGMSDQRLAEQIRADRIGILFDLAGHTAHNRLLVFARKPAPIQITWIGYEGTTGLSAMDYLIADRYMMPEGSEKYCRERVLRMPDGYLCYEPPQGAPEVGPLPAANSGCVTFCNFSNLAKITLEVAAVWAKVISRVPGSRLMMSYRGCGQQSMTQRYLDFFAQRGVEPQRVCLLPRKSYADYLAAYGQADVLLDTFPFSGNTTTCEAMWMGVPVVSCPGETFAGRHQLSHLHNIGLPELIAGDQDEFVELAVSLATDLPRLAAIRASLRPRMAASPLCDGQRFAANLAALLHDVWQQWRHAAANPQLAGGGDRPGGAEPPSEKTVPEHPATLPGAARTVLHVGCGPFDPQALPAQFRTADWKEVRLDIDPSVSPDVVASITDMSAVPSNSVDAVWSSHNLEHLYAHEVPLALREFWRVLKPGGVAVLALPDIQEVARRVAAGNLEQTLYVSPAGPICAIDIMFGHRDSIARGNHFMAHKTAFTAASLGQKLTEAGFATVDVQADQPAFALRASATK